MGRLSRLLKEIFFILMFIFVSSSALAETYYIGLSLPISGTKAKEGRNMAKAVKMYIDKLNNAGGINGNRVKLIIRNDKDDPQTAREVAQQLAQNEKLLAVIGNFSSSAGKAAADIYDEAGIVNLSPFVSNPDVIGSSDWFFSMNYNDAVQGGFMAVCLKEVLEKDNVLVIHANDTYGIGLKDSFLKKAGAIGLGIFGVLTPEHGEEFLFDFMSNNLPDKNKNRAIDAVVIFTHMEAGKELIKQVRESGIDAMIMGPDTFNEKTLLENMPEKYQEELFVTGPFSYDLAMVDANNFATQYAKQYGQPPTIAAAMSYDAALLLAGAIKEKGPDRKAIKDYLRGLDKKNSVKALTGYIYFDDIGAAKRDIYVGRAEDGRLRMAYVQLKAVEEDYILKNLAEWVKKGYVLVSDGVAYHIIDVVVVGADIFRINNVDVKDMSFDAEFFMWFKWLRDNVDVSQIDILNGVYSVSDVKYVLKEDLTKPVKYRCYRMKGTYMTPYDLRKFPFDTQFLPLLISDKVHSSTHIMLILDNMNMTRQPIMEIYPQEWGYAGRQDFSGLFQYNSTFGDPDYRVRGQRRPIFFSIAYVNVIIKRMIVPYLLTLFAPLLIIVGITLVLFWIPIDDFGIRITSALTALLSVLVFQMSMGSKLPNVGYLIKADYYFIYAYFFIFGVIATNIFVNFFRRIGKQKAAWLLDKFFYVIFIPLTMGYYLALTFLF